MIICIAHVRTLFNINMDVLFDLCTMELIYDFTRMNSQVGIQKNLFTCNIY